MMKIEELWGEIASDHKGQGVSEGEYLLRLLDPEAPFIFFAGIDSSNNLLIAIEINSTPPDLNLESESLGYFRNRRKSGTWLMGLRLDNIELAPVFGRLCQDLIDAALKMPSQAALVNFFKDRLDLWKKLFLNSHGGLLEKYQIKGLIAELIALEYLLMSLEDSMLTTLMAWAGPEGADQDFIFNDRAIEVKAISTSSTKVGISSIEQLDSILPMELWIYVLKDSSGDTGVDLNLISQVLKIEQILSTQPKAVNIFKDKILQAGYVENVFYEKYCFSVLSHGKYRISEFFPRLSRKPLPIGILEATYSISISAIDQYRILNGIK